jgi:hypothetical protein
MLHVIKRKGHHGVQWEHDQLFGQKPKAINANIAESAKLQRSPQGADRRGRAQAAAAALSPRVEN